MVLQINRSVIRPLEKESASQVHHLISRTQFKSRTVQIDFPLSIWHGISD